MKINDLVKVKNIIGIVKWIGADYPKTIKIKNLENSELLQFIKSKLEVISKLWFCFWDRRFSYAEKIMWKLYVD